MNIKIIISFLTVVILSVIYFLFFFYDVKEFETKSFIEIYNKNITKDNYTSNLILENKKFDYSIKLNKIKYNDGEKQENIFKNNNNKSENEIKIYLFEEFSFNNVKTNLIFDSIVKVKYDKNNKLLLKITDNNNLKPIIENFINSILYKNLNLLNNSEADIKLDIYLEVISPKYREKVKRNYLELSKLYKIKDIVDYASKLKINELRKVIKYKTKSKYLISIEEAKEYLKFFKYIKEFDSSIENKEFETILNVGSENNLIKRKEEKRLNNEKTFYLKKLITKNKESIVNRIYLSIIDNTNLKLKNSRLKIKINKKINKIKYDKNNIKIYY